MCFHTTHWQDALNYSCVNCALIYGHDIPINLSCTACTVLVAKFKHANMLKEADEYHEHQLNESINILSVCFSFYPILTFVASKDTTLLHILHAILVPNRLTVVILAPNLLSQRENSSKLSMQHFIQLYLNLIWIAEKNERQNILIHNVTVYHILYRHPLTFTNMYCALCNNVIQVIAMCDMCNWTWGWWISSFTELSTDLSSVDERQRQYYLPLLQNVFDYSLCSHFSWA